METRHNISEEHQFPYLVRAMAKLLSFLFHPLFIPLYLIVFLIYEAGYFSDRTDWQRKLVVIQFVVSYTLMPLLTILLMKGLGFIQSIFLHSRKDRIMPYVVCEIYYFWVWYVARNQGYDKPIILLTLAIFLASSLGLILNTYMKVSMHALSLGVMASFILLNGFSEMNYGLYIAIAFLITGLTCTARLIDSDHSTAEVYIGLSGGVLAVVLASVFV